MILKFKVNVSSLLLCMLVLASLFATLSIQPQTLSTVQDGHAKKPTAVTNTAANVTKSQEVNFTRMLPFEQSIIGEEAASVTNVTTILDEIPSFLPDQTQAFTSKVIPEHQLTTAIENITVINDHDGTLQGAGEIYLEMWINTLYTKLDNGGAYYSLNDGESTSIDQTVFTNWVNSTELFIEIKESDSDLDDSLGNITISGIQDTNISASYTTNTGDAEVWLNLTYTDYRETTFTPQALIDMYQPYLYLDNGDYADTPTALYYRVFEGYDPELADPGICLQYLYYWPKEMDNFGQDLGHYYDFSPVYVYIEQIGAAPHRLVFQENNPGSTALPAYLKIYSTSYTEINTGHINNVNVSTDLQPLLGTSAQFDYDTTPMSNIYDDPDHYTQPSSTYPYVKTPVLLVTDSYHNMQAEYISVDNTELGYFPTAEVFDYQTIYDYYQLLEESFDSPLKDYSWNNYEVPENLSLTIDMLRDPFAFPYILDCFENVTHQNRYARTSLTTEYDIYTQVNTTIIFPATMYVEYPDTVEAGQDTPVAIWVDMHENHVTLMFDYDIELQTELNMFYLSENISLSCAGRISFQIPLETISTLQTATGLNQFTDVYAFMDYLTVSSVYFDATVLGTIMNASISIHLMNIISDFVTLVKPEAEPLFEILSYFIDGLDLELTPEVTGVVTGSLDTSDPTIASLSHHDFILTTEEKHYFTMSVVAEPSSDGFTLVVSELSYGINFTTSWAITFYPGYFLVYYEVEPWSYQLGIYPNLQWSVLQPTDSLVVDISSFTSETLSISGLSPTSTTSASSTSSAIPSSSSTTTSSEETSTSGTESDEPEPTETTFLGLLWLIPVSFVLYYLKKRKTM